MFLIGHKIAIELHRSRHVAIYLSDEYDPPVCRKGWPYAVLPERVAVLNAEGQDKADAGSLMDADVQKFCQHWQGLIELLEIEASNEGGCFAHGLHTMMRWYLQPRDLWAAKVLDPTSR